MQNRNEAINALIWQCVTKEAHSGLPTVELASYLAVSHFNDGAISIMCPQIELYLDAIANKHATCKTITDNAMLAKKKLKKVQREEEKS